MTIQAIQTDLAPKAIGPYSQAVSVGGVLYLSGQIPIDPSTGEVMTGDIQEQTRLVFNNLKAVLSEGGSELSKVIKATVYLADMGDFPKVNEVYAAYFGDHKPARACVEVARLPKDVGVEIDLIALV